jgi:hypothetical protein
MTSKQELQQELLAKDREIAVLVAETLGLGEIDDLDAQAKRSLEGEVEEMIERHEEALLEGNSVEEWRDLDRRFAKTEIGRLLEERYEIAEQILDLEDDE